MFFYSPPLILAQARWPNPTGTVHGVMTDDSGAVIPAANVTLTGNGATKTAQTQADGTYTFHRRRARTVSREGHVPGLRARR